MEDAVGGRARLRAISLLAAVLGLDGADKATVGSVAAQLEKSLGVGNTQIGLLVTAATAVAVLVTLPVGMFVDRFNRTWLLTVAIVVWSVAVVIGGASSSYEMLLLTRIGLGAVTAATGPAVASLTGDLFPAAERGRIYGFVLTGELLGGGFGFLVSGEVAAALSWRWAFWVLGVLGFVLAPLLRHLFREPARGGQAALAVGAVEERAGEGRPVSAHGEGHAPIPDKVLHEDPAERSLWWAVRYVLSVRTNVVMIVASGLGWFYVVGLQTFAVVFVRLRFGLGQGSASALLFVIGIGAIIGTLVTGRLADALIRRGYIAARPVVAGACYLLATGFFLAGLLVPSLGGAVPLFFLASFGLGGANPPLDAARLDLMHSRLWGRAESVRTLLRSLLQGVAPLLFGYVSTRFGSSVSGYGGAHTGPGAWVGLDHTLMVMLVALVVSGLLMCFQARRSYPRDVATAAASEEETRVSVEA